MIDFSTYANHVFGAQLEAAHDREKELLRELTDLQWRYTCVNKYIVPAKLCYIKA